MFLTHTLRGVTTSTTPVSTTPVSTTPVGGESKDAEPVPVVIDTDVGDDIDDAFCLMLAFKLHRDGIINILCVTTSGKGSHDERAGLVLRLQRSILGEAPIPIYKGAVLGDSKRNYMSCAVDGRFETFESNVSSVVASIRAASQQVLVLCIGPLDNVRLLIDTIDDMSAIRLCLMGGSFYTSFDAKPPQIAEYNVRKNKVNWRYVVENANALIVPLDVAGDARFKEWFERLQTLNSDFQEMYNTWYKSILHRDGPTSRILSGTMPVGERPAVPGHISSVMFDAVALCIALHTESVAMVTSAVEVTEEGFTNMVAGDHKVDIALAWLTPEFFEQWAFRLA